MNEPKCLTGMRLSECWGYNLDVEELKEVNAYINQLEEKNKQLKKQLEYLRSGEYLNQLKFERNMLQDLVDYGEVSKEDKEFIDMTHKNTELLEENRNLKEKLNISETNYDIIYDYFTQIGKLLGEETCDGMLEKINKLKEQLKQRDEVIDEIYNFVNRYRHYIEVNNKDYLKDREHYGYLDKWQTDDLLEILQKYKGDNK